MIIRQARASVIQAPLAVPFRIATGQHNTLHNVFFSLVTQDGVCGFGEAAVATHITGETVEQTCGNLKQAAAVCAGENMSDCRQFLFKFRDMFEGNRAGLAAVEMAVLDAWTRGMGIPLWKLFGRSAKPLRSDITIVIGSCAEAETSARHYAQKGFGVFKIKIGKDLDLDLARVAVVKKSAPRAGIILDANQGFSAATTLKFVKALAGMKIVPLLVEQPVPKEDWDGLKKVTQTLRRRNILVCADESVKSLSDAVYALRTKSVSAINVKFMKSGILEAESIARLASAAGVELMIGAMMESSLAITAAAHFAAGLGGFNFIDLDTTYFLKGPLSRSPYLDEKGCFDLARGRAGIGVTINV